MRAALEFLAHAGAGPYPIHALDYLDVDHLSAYVDDVLVAATFDDAQKLVTLAAAPASSATVRIQRTTPRTPETREVQFLDLDSGEAGLSADLLDTDARQNLFVLGEGRDAAEELVGGPGMGLNDAGHWDGLSKRITNLSLGVDAQDALRKDQLDAAAAGVRNLPAVTGADNDDGLFVTSGEWAKRTPTQSRAHLGLGTVATLAAGVAANNVAQFDSSARYPNPDGRNIDLANNATVLARALATVVRWGGNTSFASPGIDPSVATWTQNSGSRVPHATDWSSRVELNNSGDVDGSSISPRRISLSAGQWSVRWMLKVTFPLVANTTNKTSLRITNDDDTSGQTIYYDMGLHRPNTDFSGTDYSIFSDAMMFTFGSPSAICFRWSNFASGGSNIAFLTILIQKIKV